MEVRELLSFCEKEMENFTADENIALWGCLLVMALKDESDDFKIYFLESIKKDLLERDFKSE